MLCNFTLSLSIYSGFALYDFRDFNPSSNAKQVIIQGGSVRTQKCIVLNELRFSSYKNR